MSRKNRNKIVLFSIKKTKTTKKNEGENTRKVNSNELKTPFSLIIE